MWQRIKAIFRAVPGVLVDGQETGLRCNNTGALVTTGGGAGGVTIVVFEPPLSFDTGSTVAASGVIRVAPGTLLDINGFNNSAAVRFFMLFDAVAVPGNGTAAVTVVIRVPPTSNFSITLANGQGRQFATGIAWATSSTLATLTLAAAEMLVNAQHRDP